jgi:hypothetical protein
MSLDGRRTLTLAVVCCAALVVGVGRDVETALYDDPPDAIAIQPPTGVGSGTGTFEYLDDAINSNPFDDPSEASRYDAATPASIKSRSPRSGRASLTDSSR